MKNNSETEPMAMADEEEEEEEEIQGAQNALVNGGVADICKALMERYAKSSAPQHRHLCASAAAMRSILLEEGLPLTPPAYFAAAITAIRDSDHADPVATAALSSFLSILLPLVPVQSMPPSKAKDAAFVLASLLQNPPPKSVSTAAARSMIQSLGFLVLRVDLADWSAVKLPLKTLLAFTVDRRPKVRKCAQLCVEKVFKALQSSIVIKKASKVVFCMYGSYIPMVKELSSLKLPDARRIETLSKPEHMEILHMLNVLITVVPSLSDKVMMKILFDVYKLLHCHFSLLTRHILRLLEVLLEHSKIDYIISESENIIFALTSYISHGVENPIDCVISASTLSRSCLNKLHDEQPSIWIRDFPLIFTSVAGLLNSDVNVSKHAAGILKDLINCYIDRNIFPVPASQLCTDRMESTPETTAVASICSMFDNMLSACNDVPTEHMLAVISDLFFKLGEFSYYFMKEILLKLSQWAMYADEDMPNAKHLQECIGAAVIAMGPERVLSLIPISHTDVHNISNAWLIPILKKYVIGSSLQYFMEHIVPLAKSLQKSCKKVKKTSALKSLKSCVLDIWDLLPAFCRYPTDTYQNFESLAKLLVVVLREHPFIHEIIAIALQELVNENRSILRVNQEASQSTSFILKDFPIESRSLPSCYSKKIASRNMKAMAASSMDLFRSLTDVFFDSPSEKRTYLKEAIGCLATVIGSANVQIFFVSSLEKFESIDAVERHVQESNSNEEEGETTNTEKDEQRRCLVIELVSSFIEAADKDLIDIIFNYIRPSLSATNGICQCEAYNTLSKILKDHSWFCYARIDELMDVLLGLTSPVDSMVLKSRFSCFHYVLVHLLKSNEESKNRKAFFILNEIILTLKSKTEARTLAYDILLTISCSLKNSLSEDEDSPLQRLFAMIMGYLSSSSPHIKSGAVAALSLLIYNDAGFCLAVPNLISAVLVLLQNKANEVIKAVLGFMKVLVSSLHLKDLMKLLPEIVSGILPWSSVSKHHFRSKVAIILEILMRKCGSEAVDVVVPEKYRRFVKTIAEARHNKKIPKGDASLNASEHGDSMTKKGEEFAGSLEKRPRASAKIQKEKRRKKFGKDSSSTNPRSQTAGNDGRIRWMKRANPSNQKPPFQAQTRDTDKKNKKRKLEDEPRGGKKIKIGRKTNSKNFNNAAAPSRSAASFKSNKRRIPGNPRGKGK